MGHIVKTTDASGYIAPLHLYYGVGSVNKFTLLESGNETKRDFYSKSNHTTYFHRVSEEGEVF